MINTKINRLTPVLYTNAVQATVEFYVQVIGFSCVAQHADGTWACICLDTAELMISRPNSQLSFTKPTFTGSFYFNTNAVDEIWHRLKDSAAVCYPIEDFEYGMREFAVFDNNGYLLQFGTELS